jgi:hypothetical protein
MKSLVILRNAMSIPRVTIATANSSSPIIGRTNIRSMSMPIAAAAMRAQSAESVHPSHCGTPSDRYLPGKLMIVAKDATRNAPRAESAPWAKLRTWVALKMMTNPIASSA